MLQAVQWGNAAWREDVTETTIANCWLQARVLGHDYRPMTEAEAKKQEKRQYEKVASQVSLSSIYSFNITNFCIGGDKSSAATQHE